MFKIKVSHINKMLHIMLISGMISLSFSFFTSCRSGAHYRSGGEISEIRIKVEGIRSQKGRLMLAMYHNEDNFLKNLRPAGAIQRMIFGNSIEVVFKGAFSPGEFAIALFHDEDGNGAMKSSSGGIPLEGFGFSNNPSLSRGKPGWKDTKFQVNGSKHFEVIRLTYIDE